MVGSLLSHDAKILLKLPYILLPAALRYPFAYYQLIIMQSYYYSLYNFNKLVNKNVVKTNAINETLYIILNFDQSEALSQNYDAGSRYNPKK